jgi:hypothetical protein
MTFIVFSILALMSGSTFAEWKELRFQQGCGVFNIYLEFKVFPGQHCVFLEDGSFISSGTDGVRRFNPDGSVKWVTPGNYHHQLNISPDKKRILGIQQAVLKYDDKNVKDDSLVVLDKETGKVIYERTAHDLLKENGLHPLIWPYQDEHSGLKADTEISHFNSIYEIGKNDKEKTVSFLKAGNLIVNSAGIGFFILTPDLSKTLYYTKYPASIDSRIHDVQVSNDGKILLYNNFVNDPSRGKTFSAIQKFDPVTNRASDEFVSEPVEMFFSAIGGGAQELDDDLLVFTQTMNGVYIYSRKKKKLIHYMPGTFGNPFELHPIHEVKLRDLRKFFKNQK